MEIITLKKQEQEHQQKNKTRTKAHNVRGNVFIKRQKILKKYPKLSEKKTGKKTWLRMLERATSSVKHQEL